MARPGKFCIDNLIGLDGGQETLPIALRIADGLVAAIDQPRVQAGADELVVDGSGWLAAPGFIDLQLNGGYGLDFTADPTTIPDVALRIPETGVTTFLPTFITSPLESYGEKLWAVVRAQQSEAGARIPGCHIEGPFLNPEKRGAHNAALFREPDPAALGQLQPVGAICMITLAGEVPSGIEATRWFRDQGVVVSMGHSAANTEQALEAFDSGASYATHLFNAMPALHHRDPGLAGVVLTDQRTICGLIADGIHVHPRMVQMAYQCKGADGISLVTDAMAAMGMPFGEYTIGDQTVQVDASGARLPDGQLAGSTLRMDQAVRNMVAFSGCSRAEAIRMASTTPARVLGLDDRLGRLQPGFHADVVILDSTLHVMATLVRGQVVYASPEAASRFAQSGVISDSPDTIENKQ